MINVMLHQIIDLDNRAKKIKASATARVEKIVSDKDELKERRNECYHHCKRRKVNTIMTLKSGKLKKRKDNAIKEMSSSIKSLRAMQ